MPQSAPPQLRHRSSRTTLPLDVDNSPPSLIDWDSLAIKSDDSDVDLRADLQRPLQHTIQPSCPQLDAMEETERRKQKQRAQAQTPTSTNPSTKRTRPGAQPTPNPPRPTPSPSPLSPSPPPLPPPPPLSAQQPTRSDPARPSAERASEQHHYEDHNGPRFHTDRRPNGHRPSYDRRQHDTGHRKPKNKGKDPANSKAIRCDICNITVTGQSVYDSHKKGKQHKQKLKQQNIGREIVSMKEHSKGAANKDYVAPQDSAAKTPQTGGEPASKFPADDAQRRHSARPSSPPPSTPRPDSLPQNPRNGQDANGHVKPRAAASAAAPSDPSPSSSLGKKLSRGPASAPEASVRPREAAGERTPNSAERRKSGIAERRSEDGHGKVKSLATPAVGGRENSDDGYRASTVRKPSRAPNDDQIASENRASAKRKGAPRDPNLDPEPSSRNRANSGSFDTRKSAPAHSLTERGDGRGNERKTLQPQDRVQELIRRTSPDRDRNKPTRETPRENDTSRGPRPPNEPASTFAKGGLFRLRSQIAPTPPRTSPSSADKKRRYPDSTVRSQGANAAGESERMKPYMLSEASKEGGRYQSSRDDSQRRKLLDTRATSNSEFANLSSASPEGRHTSPSQQGPDGGPPRSSAGPSSTTLPPFAKRSPGASSSRRESSQSQKIPFSWLKEKMSIAEWRELRHRVFQSGSDVDKLAYKLLQEIILSPVIGLGFASLGPISDGMLHALRNQTYGNPIRIRYTDFPEALRVRDEPPNAGEDRARDQQRNPEEWALTLLRDNIVYSFNPGEGQPEDLKGHRGEAMPVRGSYGVKEQRRGTGSMSPVEISRYKDAVMDDELFKKILYYIQGGH